MLLSDRYLAVKQRFASRLPVCPEAEPFFAPPEVRCSGPESLVESFCFSNKEQVTVRVGTETAVSRWFFKGKRRWQ